MFRMLGGMCFIALFFHEFLNSEQQGEI